MIDNAAAIAVVGLGYGDEGKGSCVDYLVRCTAAAWVVRFNGGPQAAHHVVDAEKIHCFSQFGSGTLVAGVRTFLAQSMIIDPLALHNEYLALHRIGISDAYQRLTIDPRCVIVTPFHALLNKLRETTRGTARHGSCGMGVGEVWQDQFKRQAPLLHWQDLSNIPHLKKKLTQIQADKIAQAETLVAENNSNLNHYLNELRLEHLSDLLTEHYSALFQHSGITTTDVSCLNTAFQQQRTIIFEGAQGVLLDKDRGFGPYVTPSDTTFNPAESIWAEITEQPLFRVGVLRAYSVRHGTGPFISEDSSLQLPELHNRFSNWQGAMRVGWFDAVMARYALSACGGVHRLMLNHLDRLAGQVQIKVCTAYQNPLDQSLLERLPLPANQAEQSQLTQQLANYLPHWQCLANHLDNYLTYIEKTLKIPINWYGMGPTAHDKIRP